MIPKPILYLMAAMLLVGSMPMPYGYYTILRLATCIVFGVLAYDFATRGNEVLPWLLGFVVVLFNPIIKIHFTKQAWAVLDIAVAVSLIVLSLLAPSTNRDKTKS